LAGGGALSLWPGFAYHRDRARV